MQKLKQIFFLILISIGILVSSLTSCGYVNTTFKVSFLNYDESILFVDEVEYDGTAAYEGKEPTKPSTEESFYTFSGWDKDLNNIQSDLIVHATYKTDYFFYTVNFKNYDESVLYTHSHIAKGDNAIYQGVEPTRPSINGIRYSFLNWDKPLENVTSNFNTYAVYKESTYDYTVTFKNFDGTILFIDYVFSGAEATYKGEIPNKTSDGEYNYVFKGWDKPLKNILKDTIVTAVFDSEVIFYTVTFKNYDGTTLYIDNDIRYHGKAVYEGENPTRKEEGMIYNFKGWDKPLEDVISSFETIALYTTIELFPTVTFVDYDGTILDTQTTAIGGSAVYNGKIPSRKGDDNVNYYFVGWDKPLNNIYKSTTLNALYLTSNEKYSLEFSKIISANTHYKLTGVTGNIALNTLIIPSYFEDLLVKEIDVDLALLNSLKTLYVPSSVEKVNIIGLNNTFNEFQVNEANPYFNVVNGVLYSESFETLYSYPCAKKDSIYYLNSSTKIIQKGTFNGAKFNALHLNNSLQTIEKEALINLANLTSIIIPLSVITIGANNFKNCASLLSINCEASSQLSGWSTTWNYDNINVVWGYAE